MSLSPSELRVWLARLLVDGVITPLSDEAGGALLGLARDEGVVVLMVDALAAVEIEPYPPRHFLAMSRDEARSMVAHEMARQMEARAVISALASISVRALVLKGTALAYWIYAHPAQRSRGDFDLLVEDWRHAVRAAEALRQLGYEFDGPSVEQATGYEVALERRTPGGLGHRIDLHWRLMNNAALARGLAFDELWSASINIPKLHPRARGLGQVHALAHALLHRVTNMPSGQQDRLVWLYDIHLLSAGFEKEEWQGFKQLCDEKGIAGPCLDGLRASRRVFGTMIPAEIEEAIAGKAKTESWRMAAMSNVGAMDRSHLKALSWKGKIDWVVRKLFPPAEFMRFRYGATGGIGLARAYMLRWWKGVRRALGR